MSNAQPDDKIIRTAKTCVLVALVGAVVAGCTSTPKDYAANLSTQDPKWMSAECQEIRTKAADYKERKVNWAAGALIGPYGLAIVAAGKEHQEKQRVAMARELHLKCSSQPLPKKLEPRPAVKQPVR